MNATDKITRKVVHNNALTFILQILLNESITKNVQLIFVHGENLQKNFLGRDIF